MAKRNRDTLNGNQEIVYEDDYTSVIKTDTPSMPTPVEPTFEPKAITVGDMLDTLAGYVIPTINLSTGTNEKGECMLCGRETAYSNRKLCIHCMQTYGREYYNKAKQAIENGETTIR